MAKYNQCLTLWECYYHQMDIHLCNWWKGEIKSEESNPNIVISASPFVCLIINFFKLHRKNYKIASVLKLS